MSTFWKNVDFNIFIVVALFVALVMTGLGLFKTLPWLPFTPLEPGNLSLATLLAWFKILTAFLTPKTMTVYLICCHLNSFLHNSFIF